jgi:hypothetical protein
MVKATALSIRITEPMKAALEAEADAEDRSVSSLVERVLRMWLEQRGRPLGRR